MVTDTRSDQPPSSGATQTLSPAGGAASSERGFDIAIARDGGWWHEGAPIRRIELVRLFASVLRREADGSYWLVTPVERGRIAVEDVPFVAVELRVAGSGRAQELRLRSNLDEWVTVGPDHPLRVRPAGPPRDAAEGEGRKGEAEGGGGKGEAAPGERGKGEAAEGEGRKGEAAGGEAALIPYVELRPGLEARLERAVYYQLVELGETLEEPRGSRFGVWSGGRFFALDQAE